MCSWRCRAARTGSYRYVEPRRLCGTSRRTPRPHYDHHRTHLLHYYMYVCGGGDKQTSHFLLKYWTFFSWDVLVSTNGTLNIVPVISKIKSVEENLIKKTILKSVSMKSKTKAFSKVWMLSKSFVIIFPVRHFQNISEP